jgi:1,4-dihydroxy-2-naphthoyl-CoA synthase
MTKKYKKKQIEEHYLTNPKLTSIFEEKLDYCVAHNIKITKTRMKKETKLKPAEVDALYHHYCEAKSTRIEMNCTILDKKIWKHKADQAGKTVSQIASESLHKTRIIVPFAEQTRKEMLGVINERVRFNSLLNQTVKWCNTHKSGAEAIQILLELNQLNKAFEQHDLRVMNILASPEVDHKYRISHVDPLAVEVWQ